MAHIAMPLAADFEDSEYTVPRQRLEQAGHDVTVLGKKAGETVDGKRGRARARVDRDAAALDPEQFDALVIPGGFSPDHLRTDPDVVDFVRRFVETGRPVAAICHGPQLLIEADAVDDREMTSWASVRKDLQNAGAHWKDAEVVIDGNLVTSRKPDDLEAFCDAVLAKLESESDPAR